MLQVYVPKNVPSRITILHGYIINADKYFMETAYLSNDSQLLIPCIKNNINRTL